jgi:anti-sigma regulatory factor (Ser/Thr protein kinase)
MRLAHDTSAAPQARRYARNWATELRVPEPVVADLELVVTELVANAVVHAAPPYDLELRRSGGVIRGEVSDASDTPPSINSDPDHHGGFGLRIVAARATRWGIAPLGRASEGNGKRVWFEIDHRGDPPLPRH